MCIRKKNIISKEKFSLEKIENNGTYVKAKVQIVIKIFYIHIHAFLFRLLNTHYVQVYTYMYYIYNICRYITYLVFLYIMNIYGVKRVEIYEFV